MTAKPLIRRNKRILCKASLDRRGTPVIHTDGFIIKKRFVLMLEGDNPAMLSELPVCYLAGKQLQIALLRLPNDPKVLTGIKIYSKHN